MSIGVRLVADRKVFFDQLGPRVTSLDTGASGILKRYFYYDRTDTLYWRGRLVSSGSIDRTLKLDPLFLDATSPRSEAINPVEDVGRPYAVGDWDRNAATQKAYQQNNGNFLSELDLTDLSYADIDPFGPNMGYTTTRNGDTLGVEGFWDNALGTWLIFEGMNEAINTHVGTVTFDSTNWTDISVSVDLTSGKATPITDMPFISRNTPNIYQMPAVDGDAFEFSFSQFVPDEDSTPAAPKGRILSWPVAFDGALTVGSVYRWYFIIYEWNPTNVVGGNPTRTNKRRILLTRYNSDRTNVFPVEPFDPATGGNPDRMLASWWFHPRSTFPLKHMWHNETDAETTILAGTACDTDMLNNPSIDLISSAYALDEIKTASTVRFGVDVLGDLGERISAASVDFTLERVSTVQEAVSPTPSGGPSPADTVTNVPIDAGTLVIFHDGTALVEDTDYTVTNLATGAFTMIGGHDPLLAGVYTASYGHSTVALAPANGTLLVASASSDDDGIALTRVRYDDDDDLVRGFDKLTADA